MREKMLIDVLVFLFGMTSVVSLTRLIGLYVTRKTIHPPALDALEARLVRIEQTVDTSAIEIERISEGQRFTTRLLAERKSGSSGVPRAYEPTITPH
jgi:hypothetical protein